MKRTLNIGLDLGGDTIKIAFAFDLNGETVYGKFDGNSRLTQIAIPSLAYYDTEKKSWIFGQDVIYHGGESFITVVKIKSLISLLTKQENASILQQNENYYFNGNEFPKFYFPIRRRMLDDFDLMVKQKSTFTAPNYTPQSVCQSFFNYVKDIVNQRTRELSQQTNVQFEGYNLALVHPSSVGDEYVHELSDLIENAFNIKPSKILSSNKALSIYALQRGAVSKSEDFLVFDMGEETISVVRAGTLNGQIIIDGVDGHNEPKYIGGIDVDEAIVRKLEGSVLSRETIGSPSAGSTGHISEQGVYGKQYLLMKDIKKAKVIFSKDLPEDSLLKDGLPISLNWDLYIQLLLTNQDVKDCIGVTEDKGIAKEIADYIISEAKRPINRGVKKMFISGGLTETYSLLDYIKEKVETNVKGMKICTFDDAENSNDQFTICSYEDSVYAPAVGGAIVALKNIEIKTIVSLSYGVWALEDKIKVLALFLERGTPIVDNAEHYESFNLGGEGSSGEELFSTPVTNAEILKNKINGKWRVSPKGYLYIGEPRSPIRKKATEDVDLHTLTGGKGGKIRFMYNNRFVKLNERISILQGIKVDKNGRATPFVKNGESTRDKRVILIHYPNNTTQYVYAKDIVVIMEGLESVTIVENN